MGPENDPLNLGNATLHIQDESGEWVPIKEVKEIEWVPLLEPGRLFGQDVQQVRPGVYEIPDLLLAQVSPNTAELLNQVVAEFLRHNPDVTIWREYDVPRRVTVLTVEKN